VITGTAAPFTEKRDLGSRTFKNILVAVTKRCGMRAIEAAARLATPGFSRVMLLHLQERITYPRKCAVVNLETYAEAVDFAAKMQAELRELGIEGQVKVGRELSGWEACQILIAAYDLGADLLIAGNRRKSRLYALLTGSTTLDIVRMSAITVCLVPQRQ